MVRVKVQMKKIENKTYRQITFAKRKSGLIKKAYELSTLCDVEVALIIFSPAGKLFLFEGNERLEEILSHLIELPARRRACQPLLQCVQNEELIRDVINKLTLESSFANHPMVSRNNRTDIDSQLLQEVQRDILLCSAQLEDVEKQLQCFLGDPSGFNSMRECQYIEMLLEQTLKLIHSRKQVLESKGNATCPEIGDAINPLMVNCTGAQKASWNGSIPPSSNWESNIDLHAPSTIGLQLSRNSEEPLAGEPPSQMMHPLAGVDLNIQPAVDGCIPHPPSGIVNPNFPPGMGITKQATKSSSGAQAGSSRRELSADLWLKL